MSRYVLCVVSLSLRTNIVHMYVYTYVCISNSTLVIVKVLLLLPDGISDKHGYCISRKCSSSPSVRSCLITRNCVCVYTFTKVNKI